MDTFRGARQSPRAPLFVMRCPQAWPTAIRRLAVALAVSVAPVAGCRRPSPLRCTVPFPEQGRKKLQRLTGLRLLFGPQIDAQLGEERPRLRRGEEDLRWRAPGRQLQEAGAVGKKPHLPVQLAREAFGREPVLEHQDRTKDRQVVQRETAGRVRGIEVPLALREER